MLSAIDVMQEGTTVFKNLNGGASPKTRTKKDILMSTWKHSSLMSMLQEHPELRPQVIRDCVLVLDEEVNRKSGVTGLMIKGGFKVIKNLKGGKMVDGLIDFLLDEFMEALDPFYQEYKALEETRRGSFSSFLSNQSGRAAEAMLSVTDKRRQRASTKVLIKTYDSLRPTALKHVEEGVPAVGRLVEKYIGP